MFNLLYVFCCYPHLPERTYYKGGARFVKKTLFLKNLPKEVFSQDKGNGSSGKINVTKIIGGLSINIEVPYQNFTSEDKKSITKANQKRCKKATKKEKTIILNDLQQLINRLFEGR